MHRAPAPSSAPWPPSPAPPAHRGQAGDILLLLQQDVSGILIFNRQCSKSIRLTYTISLLSACPTRPLLRLLFNWALLSAPAGLETKYMNDISIYQIHHFCYLAARFRFWSRLKADPVFKASMRLSMTPSWLPEHNGSVIEYEYNFVSSYLHC